MWKSIRFFMRTILPITALVLAACSGAPQNLDANTTSPATEEVQMESSEHEEGGEHTEEGGDDHMEAEEHPHDEGEEHTEGEEQTHEQGDEHAHVHADTPQEYADLTNPLDGDAQAIEAGQSIYETNCAVCHGPEGDGDGPGTEALDPKPAPLSDVQMMSDLSDGYLFWRVTEGGNLEPFNSVMPAWEEALSENQRWQVIAFLRTLGTP